MGYVGFREGTGFLLHPRWLLFGISEPSTGFLKIITGIMSL